MLNDCIKLIILVFMLTERQGEVLVSVVQEYTLTATPVSSSLLKEKYLPEYSSATLRNELANLEKEGFLIKPHTSAGRIPSDRGYRYFVDNFLDPGRLSPGDQKRLQVEMLKLKAQNVRLSRTLAKTLSASSRCLALSGLPKTGEFYDFGMHTLLEDPEFQQLGEFSRISATLDLIDENVERIVADLESEEGPKIYIGGENPIEEIRSCSMIASSYHSEDGDSGIIAIIGPKRMQYGRNKSLIDFVRKLFLG